MSRRPSCPHSSIRRFRFFFSFGSAFDFIHRFEEKDEQKIAISFPKAVKWVSPFSFCLSPVFFCFRCFEFLFFCSVGGDGEKFVVRFVVMAKTLLFGFL